MEMYMVKVSHSNGRCKRAGGSPSKGRGADTFQQSSPPPMGDGDGKHEGEREGKRKKADTFQQSSPPSISPALLVIHAHFQEHYYYKDTDAIDVVLAIPAGNHLDMDPAWLQLIAAPSSGKTELL